MDYLNKVVYLLGLVVAFSIGSSVGHEERIIGGTAANIVDYPYSLSLMYNGYHRCGAAIISTSWAITAASCVNGIRYSALSVRGGSNIRTLGGQPRMINNYTIHPNYNSVSADYDLALLTVTVPFNFTNTNSIGAASLYNGSVAEGTTLAVSGWGIIKPGTSVLYTTTQLQAINATVVNQNTCNTSYNNGVTQSMFCASTPTGKGICNGDGGDPAVLTINGNRYLSGIASWGANCGLTTLPGVYANVSAVRGWIQAVSGI